jgi:hypothetical protein
MLSLELKTETKWQIFISTRPIIKSFAFRTLYRRNIGNKDNRPKQKRFVISGQLGTPV